MKGLLLLIFTVLLCQCLSAQNPTLTAVYDPELKEIKLRWQHTDMQVSSYTIQRSSDNSVFTDIFTKNTKGLTEGELLKFHDRSFSSEKNYYRLKIFRGSKLYEATIPVMIITSNTESGWIIYPVPVGSVINLQYTGSDEIRDVLTVTIQSLTSGTVFTRLRLATTQRTVQIPVDHIGKGIYDIRIYKNDRPVWNQRFVK